MSDNPKTKAYQRRVERLGKAIHFYLGRRSLDDVIREKDPTASARLIEAAIQWAIEDRQRMQQIFRESVERDAEEIIQLEQLLQSRRRPALRLVGGSEAA